jgi:hypothetical protein
VGQWVTFSAPAAAPGIYLVDNSIKGLMCRCMLGKAILLQLLDKVSLMP